MHKFLSYIILIICVSLLSTAVGEECKECVEVAKGKIPANHLDESLKELPSGIPIWDLEEVMPALKNAEAKILWVDTRPNSFFKQGTIKKAVLLVCDLMGVPIPDADKGNAISKEKLTAEMKKIDADINKVTVVFFCQGPKCHRSYNAAIRSVKEYGLNESKVVWFRAGYPNLEKHIKEDPKLNKRITKYLKGSTVTD